MNGIDLSQLNVVSPQEILSSYPQYSELLRFKKKIHCNADGELRFVPNPLVGWLLSTGAVDLDDLEAAHRYGHFPRSAYLSFLLGVGFTLDYFLTLDVVQDALSRGMAGRLRRLREQSFDPRAAARVA